MDVQTAYDLLCFVTPTEKGRIDYKALYEQATNPITEFLGGEKVQSLAGERLVQLAENARKQCRRNLENLANENDPHVPTQKRYPLVGRVLDGQTSFEIEFMRFYPAISRTSTFQHTFYRDEEVLTREFFEYFEPALDATSRAVRDVGVNYNALRQERMSKRINDLTGHTILSVIIGGLSLIVPPPVSVGMSVFCLGASGLLESCGRGQYITFTTKQRQDQIIDDGIHIILHGKHAGPLQEEIKNP